jgi:predicted GNAT family acetyltransferase
VRILQAGRRDSAGLAWRRAVRADLPALRAFLEADEAARVGFSGRLITGGELRLPSSLRGAVWLADAGRGSIAGALLCHPSRLAFPIFPAVSGAACGEASGDPASSAKLDRDLSLLTSSFAPASALGLSRDVERYEAALSLSPRACVAYLLMRRSPRPREVVSHNAPAYPALSLRRAEPADLEALLPLQEAYEREEVLTCIHSFNASACRASLSHALERQLVYVAQEGGVIVGKACTNARGFGADQIGGVYTLPERRGRGVARSLVSALLYELDAAGRGSSLFVKPTNASARALYLGLGFEDIGDYRADYFEA